MSQPKQSGTMAIRSLKNWLRMESPDFTLVTFEDRGEDLEPKVNRLATGTWEHCKAVMDDMTPKTTLMV